MDGVGNGECRCTRGNARLQDGIPNTDILQYGHHVKPAERDAGNNL